MKFKNIIAYLIPQDFSFNCSIDGTLSVRPLQEPAPFERRSIGWVRPLASSSEYAIQIEGFVLVTLGVNEKVLPGSVINQRVAKAAAKLAEDQGHPVGKRQARELKQSITDKLLSEAIVKQSNISALLDLKNKWLFVEASSHSKAELLVDFMRDTFGSFPVYLPMTANDPQSVMTSWASPFAPPDFLEIQDFLELSNRDNNKNKVIYKNRPKNPLEVYELVQSNMLVSSMGLSWRDQVFFKIDPKLSLKSIDFYSIKEIGEQECSSEYEELQLNLLIKGTNMAAIFIDLMTAMGGEQLQLPNLEAAK